MGGKRFRSLSCVHLPIYVLGWPLRIGRKVSIRVEHLQFSDSPGWQLHTGRKGIRPHRRRRSFERLQWFGIMGWQLRVGRNGIRQLRRRIVKARRIMGAEEPDWPILCSTASAGRPEGAAVALRSVVRSRTRSGEVRGLLSHRGTSRLSLVGVVHREEGLQLGKPHAGCWCNHG